MKNAVGILTGTALNLYLALGSRVIFNNIKLPSPSTWNIIPFVCLFPQCHTVLSMQVFLSSWLSLFLDILFFSSHCINKWDCFLNSF